MLEMWERLDARARAGLIAGSLAVLVLVGGLAIWAYRPDYQILFRDMAPQDAAAMTAELEKMKTPYQLSDNGNTILVPKDVVYKTRLKLMGKDVPLHGAVGFEVFNNADFGMTDFVQKVNYQRALQGELTRTILSIDDIQSARVHLALPEQGLFKKATSAPKASVTVAMKPGRVLEPAQVVGIQRLIAASVPDIAAADVTVLDQHGIALTRAGGGALTDGSAQLDAKRAAEEYLGKKVAQVLDQTFGPGEAIASVDLALNLDQTKVTTDEVLPSQKASDAEGPKGVVVRERYTIRDGNTDQAALAASPKAQADGTTNAEAEYQLGRRVEQVAVAPGSVKRMTIAVVVKQALTEEQRARLSEVVALAAGLNAARGDAIVVSTMNSLVTGQDHADGQADAHAVPESDTRAQPAPALRSSGVSPWLIAAIVIVALAGAGLVAHRRRLRPAPVKRLTEGQRAHLVAEVRAWTQMPSADAEHGP